MSADVTDSFLTRWFAIMDSDTPDRVLDLVDDDFQLGIVFSTGGQAADFAGDRAALVGYLAQRERGTRTHHLLSHAITGHDELFLGEVRRSGEFEASFVAAGRVGPSGKLTRLLIGRSPAANFSDVPGGN
ncbi:hypothetical protein GIS00_25330 [Nakamurella sp. YIM 132087]|uniref:Nuclear transport factor 2 family protein n=1 Tax=Nakamurella alba TaxID=2665158 RepID=A0A7K1FT04_9ACTN|nr:hypothetical protein [Nakamurella alba]MTD17258.1 hypothetical protein [Nakamurella alba]